MSLVSENHLISAIHVEALFGLYTYTIPDDGRFSNATILYGDNGIGKSTLLRLTFHLLSMADDRGHRGALYEAEFRRLEVSLASGVKLVAERVGQEEAVVLKLSVLHRNKHLVFWDFIPRPKRLAEVDDANAFSMEMSPDGQLMFVRKKKSKIRGAQANVPHGEKAYFEVLGRYVPTMFMLNAERRLHSDSVPDPSDEIEIRRIMRFEEAKKISDLVARAREIALSQAIDTAARWFSQKALQGANQGSMNVHAVYVSVLDRLATPASPDVSPYSSLDLTSLLKRLSLIEAQTLEFAKYELATTLSTNEFKKALSARRGANSKLAADLLTPYISSLEGRLAAVAPIYSLVDKFVKMINGFLTDKAISFTLSGGFRITNRLGNVLTAAQLSSGEQQLILLFCYVLTGRDRPSVFMIDEPELSLNVKWQRQLIQSLLDLTEGANVQFVFASHSMELLAQHRNRVVRLVNLQ